MARYFIEVSYKGTRYSGFQVQDNAVTIQSEIEKAFETLHRVPVRLTGSSRTDSGVHALQNFFHFDFDRAVHPQAVYKLNAILSKDIVVRNLYLLHAEAHSRFDATSREYLYRIHRFKNPFLQDTSLYYPYDINIDLLQKGASYIAGQHNFFAFSKTNTQVKNFNCHIYQSYWTVDGDSLAYHITGNRFLRGMVRIITATLLKYARGKISDHEFENLFSQEKKGGHSAPAHGLYLKKVEYPENYFPTSIKHFTAF
jgi:tRNA pseudouridine38-40 synthase